MLGGSVVYCIHKLYSEQQKIEITLCWHLKIVNNTDIKKTLQDKTNFISVGETDKKKHKLHGSNRKAINRNWSNQKPNPALKTDTGNE